MAQDAFQEDVERAETADGPFRTHEPPKEARYARARERSLERVAEATARELARERGRARRRRTRAWLGVLALLAAAVTTVAVAGLWGDSWVAGACPAVSLVLVAAIVAFRLHRAPRV